MILEDFNLISDAGSCSGNILSWQMRYELLSHSPTTEMSATEAPETRQEHVTFSSHAPSGQEELFTDRLFR